MADSSFIFKNNIQGKIVILMICLNHPDLVKRQDEYIRKIVQEVNSFDNVILEKLTTSFKWHSD
jgi:hypothetical protein